MKNLVLKTLHWSKMFREFCFLLGKARWQGVEQITEEELFIIIGMYDQLETCENYDFVITRRMKLIKLQTLVEILINCKARPYRTNRVYNSEYDFLLRSGIIPNAFEYFGWEKHYHPNKFVRRYSQKDRRIKKVRRFIGVGYKDQGNMKNIALDGTPSWQEVANSKLPYRYNPREENGDYKLLLNNWGYQIRDEDWL